MKRTLSAKDQEILITNNSSVLVYGFGNPGRNDDALGILFSEKLEEMNFPNISFDSNYQLNAEDALLISEFDIVIFADASLTPESFSLKRLKPAPEVSFTTHAMHPSSVVALCNQLYNKHPLCFLMEIRGYEWEMREQVSDRAMQNLKKALEYTLPLIKERRLFVADREF